MLKQWQPSDSFPDFPAGYRNFGDHLPYLFEHLFAEPDWKSLVDDPANSYTLIGSVLMDVLIAKRLAEGQTPHYMGCGYRGDDLSADVIARVNIYGCRGYLTQKALKAAGKDVEVIGDPGALVPLFIPSPLSTGKKLFIPHLLDPKVDHFTASKLKCDQIIIPLTMNDEHLVEMIREIASAGFVLAGAMHAAVVAHAYGVPFAFFDAGYRDCPKKWEDWASCIGLAPSRIAFVQDFDNGMEWYKGVRKDIRRPRLVPILEQLNLIKTVRQEWGKRAMLFDVGNGF